MPLWADHSPPMHFVFSSFPPSASFPSLPGALQAWATPDSLSGNHLTPPELSPSKAPGTAQVAQSPSSWQKHQSPGNRSSTPTVLKLKAFNEHQLCAITQ